ncbi:MAG: DUF3800 domain-containing protein [Actinobacteria bacterium]|nr:DUF3800 domain-containing protein [Actinomycetota bacterium]
MGTRLAFVDDTKQKGSRDGMGSLVSLGAVVFEHEKVKPWIEAVTKGLQDLGCPLDAEVKWSTEKGTYYREAGASKLTDVREMMLREAAAAEVRATVVIIDQGRTYISGAPVEKRVFEYLWERLEMQIANANDLGVVIFDKPSGDHKDEARWISEHSLINQVGTNYVRPGSFSLAPLTAPSHLHLPLQLADLVAGATTAAVSGNKFGEALMPLIAPLLLVGSYGTVGGSGLKLWPDDLGNLYKILLGETSIIRGGNGVGLAYEGFAYYEEAGGVPRT